MAESRLHRFTVVYEIDKDGVWIAECIDLKSCYAHGATKDEARDNLREVIALALEAYEGQGWPVPGERSHVGTEFLDVAV